MSICAAVLIKESLHRLPEWLLYHRLLGVDQFFICQDVCSKIELEMTERVIKEYKEKQSTYPDSCYWGAGKIFLFDARELFPDTITKPHSSRQTLFYNYVFNILKEKNANDWLACIDIDEFLVPYHDGTLSLFLERFDINKVRGIKLRQLAFGCGDTRDIPLFPVESVIDTCRCYIKNYDAFKCITSVVGAESVEVHCPHGCKPLVNPLGKHECTHDPLLSGYEIAFYAHYIQPSWEELSSIYRHAYFPYNDYDPQHRKDRCNTTMNRFRNNKWINYPNEDTFNKCVKSDIVSDLFCKRLVTVDDKNHEIAKTAAASCAAKPPNKCECKCKCRK
jgi:hypothetical protein